MDEDPRNSDGIVIVMAVVLVFGLLIGAVVFAKNRAMRALEAQQQQWGALRPQQVQVVRTGLPAPAPAGAPKASRVSFPEARGLGETLLFDSNRDWVYYRFGADGALDVVVFGIDVHEPALAGDSLTIGALRVPKQSETLVRVLDEDGLGEGHVALTREALAAAIRALSQGTESIDAFLTRISGPPPAAAEEGK